MLQAVAAVNNPKYDKRYKGGEDSFVICKSQRMLGVFDGVGGWGEVEVCSGKFSKFLSHKIGELFQADPSQSLKQILVDAVKANPNGGSSTAVLAKVENTQKF